MNPTLEYFQQHLSYDPDTGIFTWKAGGRKRKHGAVAGTLARGYLNISIDYVTYRAHRIAWLFITGQWPEQVIDHINGDRADNRAANLRDVSVAQNCQGARTISPRNKSATPACPGTRRRIATPPLACATVRPNSSAASIPRKRRTQHT